MTRFSVRELADGVFAFVQPDGGWCLSNAGFVVGEDQVVVIDTAATERRARALRAAIASVTTAVPRIVVNTHFHGDHTFGNGVFLPEATVVAHDRARAEMAVAGLGLTGLWPGVDWGRVSVDLPTVTYWDRMTLHVDGLRLELIHPGPAHTTTDTVVWVPDREVLFVGDIAMNGVTPFCLMGSVRGSLRTIEELRLLGAGTVVTGHGPVSGPEVLDENEAYLRWLQVLAAEGIRTGRTPLQLAGETDLGPYAHWLDAERLVANLHRAYAEHEGAPDGAELDVSAIFAEMVDHHGGLPACHA